MGYLKEFTAVRIRTEVSDFNKKLDQEAPNLRTDLVVEAMRKLESDCIAEVLTRYLGRIPVAEDYKECTKLVYEGRPESYDLQYQNIIIGRFCIRAEGWKFIAEFEFIVKLKNIDDEH
jgi:hypothetical protein